MRGKKGPKENSWITWLKFMTAEVVRVCFTNIRQRTFVLGVLPTQVAVTQRSLSNPGQVQPSTGQLHADEPNANCQSLSSLPSLRIPDTLDHQVLDAQSCRIALSLLLARPSLMQRLTFLLLLRILCSCVSRLAILLC